MPNNLAQNSTELAVWKELGVYVKDIYLLILEYVLEGQVSADFFRNKSAGK